MKLLIQKVTCITKYFSHLVGSISPSTKYLSFLDARMFCLDRGSDLLVIANIQSNLTELDEGIYWIGLKRFSVMWYPGIYKLVLNGNRIRYRCKTSV